MEIIDPAIAPPLSFSLFISYFSSSSNDSSSPLSSYGYKTFHLSRNFELVSFFISIKITNAYKFVPPTNKSIFPLSIFLAQLS